MKFSILIGIGVDGITNVLKLKGSNEFKVALLEINSGVISMGLHYIN